MGLLDALRDGHALAEGDAAPLTEGGADTDGAVLVEGRLDGVAMGLGVGIGLDVG